MKPLWIKVATILAAVLAGAGLAILGPASTADADTSAAISLQGPATLISHGVAVSQTVVVSCPAGLTAEVNTFITQAVGKRIASGSGFQVIECTGSPQALPTTMTNNSSVAFSKGGTAMVGAGVFGCGPVDCSQATTNAIVKIK